MSGAWVAYVEARSPKRTLHRELDASARGWRNSKGERVELSDAEVCRRPFVVAIVVRSPDVARRRRELARVAK